MPLYAEPFGFAPATLYLPAIFGGAVVALELLLGLLELGPLVWLDDVFVVEPVDLHAITHAKKSISAISIRDRDGAFIRKLLRLSFRERRYLVRFHLSCQ